MTELLPRTVIERANPKLNVSRNANLPHSPGIRVGSYIFLSGMGPVDPVTGGRNLGPIAEQIRQTLRNMEHMLDSAGSSLDRIVKITVVLANSGDYDELNRVWREFFPADPYHLRFAAQQRQRRRDRVHHSRWIRPGTRSASMAPSSSPPSTSTAMTRATRSKSMPSTQT